MTRLLYIAILAFILAGCGASRRTIKSDIQTAVETVDTLHAETTTERQSQWSTHTEQAKNEEVTTCVTEFDTSLPVNPTTGTPPVLRKTTQTKRAITTARQDVVAEERGAATFGVDASTATKEQTATMTEEKSRKGLNWWQTTLCTIGAAAMLVLVLWVAARRFKH